MESSTASIKNDQSLQRGPDFFIVGATKAGTTSLYYYLSAHPEVYMSPVKEPHHFATDIDLENLRPQVKRRLKAQETEKFIENGMHGTLHRAYIRDRELYLKLYESAGNAKVVGEASPSNLFSKSAAKEILKYNQKAKILIILRNPVDRAYSHYLMDRKLGFTNLNFTAALLEDEKAIHKSWGAASNYIELGLYFEQVKRYYDNFPTDQIKVVLQEELKKEPAKILREVYHFLCINENYQPDLSKKFNEAMVPRNALMHRLLNMDFLRVYLREKLKNSPVKKTLKKILFTPPEEEKPDTATIERLQTLFQPDIEKLSVLLKRDLSEWT